MPITVKHLTVYDPQHRRRILQDLSCQIEEGQITLLVGKPGAGKSTFLDALAGLTETETGTIAYEQGVLWQGKRVNAAIQRTIGYVFQFPEQQLFAQTVQGEFEYSLHYLKLDKAHRRERMLKALGEMGLPGQITASSPLILSAGQKRRVALASTFATRSDWLLLDEPTAGLDSETTQRLLEFLLASKQRMSGGIIIATHDVETLLPIADRVFLLQGGHILATTTPHQLCLNPHLLVRAEVGIPPSLEFLSALHERGIALSEGPLSPQRYAEYLLQSLQASVSEHAPISPSPRTEAIRNKEVELPCPLPACTETENAEASPPERLIEALDPRSKWFFYLLVSIGIFLQTSLPGLILGGVVTLCSLLLSRVPSRTIVAVMKPFSFLMLFSVILSAIQFSPIPHQWHLGPVYFSLNAALFTFAQLYKILLIMILGVLFSATTSQLKMKRGLEQSLSALRSLKLPVEAFSLGASLMLHFIPVILKEAQRFSRITRTRGKRQTKAGTIHVRDFSALVIPLTLSLLQLGSHLSLAMEARGYTHLNARRTASDALSMRMADVWVILTGISLLCVFFLLKYGILGV